jgi:nucleotide-binding universal stress UspA family protein
MFTRILVPLDPSARSQEAARVAIEVARRFKAQVVAVHVIAPYSPGIGEVRATAPGPLTAEEYRRLTEKSGQAMLDKAAAAAKQARVACETVLMANREPVEGILAAAKKHKADLIVMASSQRRGIERFFMGSVSTDVLAKAKQPVMVCR